MWPIVKVNGKTFTDFHAFLSLLQEAESRYCVLEDSDGVKVIIDRKEALGRQHAILRKYNIEFDRSADLRKKQLRSDETQ
jgi:hypothetical protein